MRSVRVLLLASDPTEQRRIQLLLDAHEFLVAAVAGPAEARRALRSEIFDGIIVDVVDDPELHFVEEQARLGGSSPENLAGSAAEASRLPILVVVDGQNDEPLQHALKAGAGDVVGREVLGTVLVHRLRTVLRAARRSVSHRPGAGRERKPSGVLRRAGRRKTDLLVGRSADMLALAEQIGMIAKTDIGVAVYGETGTGKELVARTIHAASPRARKPYVVANCTALPETLFENELFGHEKGAFTGADARQEGLLREAEAGTLVLDEIGDLHGGVQAKLLRLLQFREFKMVGGTKTLHADVRILTTTHRDLGKAVSAGRFREDLFYRLNTLQITIPPLRDRLDDIPLLVDHFVSLFNEREGRDFIGFSPSAVGALQRYSWPGNVRELESVVYRSLVMAGSERLLDGDGLQLGQSTVPESVDLSRPFADLKTEAVESFERRYLQALLRHTRGNLSEAARAARHERKSLWRLLRKYGIRAEAFRDEGSS